MLPNGIHSCHGNKNWITASMDQAADKSAHIYYKNTVSLNILPCTHTYLRSSMN